MAGTHVVDVHNLVITIFFVLVISRQDELVTSFDGELGNFEYHSSKVKVQLEIQGTYIGLVPGHASTDLGAFLCNPSTLVYPAIVRTVRTVSKAIATGRPSGSTTNQ